MSRSLLPEGTLSASGARESTPERTLGEPSGGPARKRDLLQHVAGLGGDGAAGRRLVVGDVHQAVVEYQRVDGVAQRAGFPVAVAVGPHDVGQVVDGLYRAVVGELVLVGRVDEELELMARGLEAAVDVLLGAGALEPLGAEAAVGVL